MHQEPEGSKTMSASVALSVGMRNALYLMADITTQQSVSNKLLSTGKKFNDVLDGAINYFMVRRIAKNRSDLSNLLEHFPKKWIPVLRKKMR